jgi:hypothetical protein
MNIARLLTVVVAVLILASLILINVLVTLPSFIHVILTLVFAVTLAAFLGTAGKPRWIEPFEL